MTALALGALSCAAWLFLLAARGGFWRAAQLDDGPVSMPSQQRAWPHVVAVIPARDEAELIGDTIIALLRQDYAGAFAVIVVVMRGRPRVPAAAAEPELEPVPADS